MCITLRTIKMQYTDNKMLWGKFIERFGSFHDISTPVGQATSDLNEIFMSTDLDVSVICVNVCVFIIFTFRVILFEILSFFKFSYVLIGKKIF